MVTFKNEESELSFQGLAPRSGWEKRPNRPETGHLARLSDMRKNGERKRSIRQDWCQPQRGKGPKAAWTHTYTPPFSAFPETASDL